MENKNTRKECEPILKKFLGFTWEEPTHEWMYGNINFRKCKKCGLIQINLADEFEDNRWSWHDYWERYLDKSW